MSPSKNKNISKNVQAFGHILLCEVSFISNNFNCIVI